MNVKTAFLNCDLDEDISMQQPDGYCAAGNKANHIWKLNKSLMATGTKLIKTDPADTTSTEVMDNVLYSSAVGALM